MKRCSCDADVSAQVLRSGFAVALAGVRIKSMLIPTLRLDRELYHLTALRLDWEMRYFRYAQFVGWMSHFSMTLRT